MDPMIVRDSLKTPPPAGKRGPLGAQIGRSVLFGGLRYFFVAPIPLLMTPLILRKIGPVGYGTWAVFLAVNALTSLADLGLVGTLSKFVAEYHAGENFASLTRLLCSGLALFLFLGGLVSAALWGAAPILVSHLFHESAMGPPELIFLLRCFIVVIAANILSQLFASILSGLQRLDLTITISTINALLSAVCAAALLLRGWGLRGLVYGYIFSGVVTIGIYLVAVRKLLPHVVINPLRFSLAEARKMFGYSLRLYITQAAVAVHNQVEKVFLALLVGVAPAGWYDIAGDTAIKIRGAIGFILNPVLPAASELNALGDEQRLRELYYRAHKYLAFVGIPVVCFVAATASRFIDLWLGPTMHVIAIPLCALLIANFFNLASGPGFLIFAGRGYMAPGIRSALFGLALNFCLSLSLIYKFGFAGAVVGTSISVILASGYFMWLFHQHTGYAVARVLREAYLKPILCSAVTIAGLMVVRPTGNLGWFGLIVLAVCFGGFYVLGILLSGFFDDYDWDKMEALLPTLRLARKMSPLA
jgi:O-antigen/teichoic acid export membrane protein